MKERKTGWIAAVVAFIAGVAVMAVCGFAYLKATGKIVTDERQFKEYEDVAERYAKVAEIEDLIREKYLWDIDEDQLTESLCDAMLQALGDPYSRYLSAEELEKMKNSLTGDMVGIGLSLYAGDDGSLTVSDVLDESPAAASGLRSGDVITEIDGSAPETVEDAAELLFGEAGTSVSLTYERGGSEETVSVVRGEIRENSVNSVMLRENIGYIRIKRFGEKTAEEFNSELSAMEEKQVSGVVIDLRGNSGGLVEQGIAVADILLPEGTITYTEDKDGNRETFNSDSVCTGLNYVLLVDKDTASAAEILAAAVKDAGGVLVGETTYGKGVIQETTIFDDGTGAILTTRQYFSPSGAVIHEKGVKPTLEMTRGEEKGRDMQLEGAMEAVKERM